MNFVFTAEVRSYVHAFVSAWPAPMGGWWLTCSETYTPGLAPGRVISHVSPRMGLNGFFTRSLLL